MSINKNEITVTENMTACREAYDLLSECEREARLGRGDREATWKARRAFEAAQKNLDCWLVCNGDAGGEVMSVHETRESAHNAIAKEQSAFAASIHAKTGGYIHRYVVGFDGANEWE